MPSLSWTPNGVPLLKKTIDLNINDSVSANYTTLGTDIISNVTCTWNNTTSLILTPSFTTNTATVTITGLQDISVFDQYSVQYIDKNFSDLSQTPVVQSNLALVPNAKEIYKINVDPRLSINLSFDVNVFITNLGVPLTTYTNTFNFDMFQTYTNVKTWTDDYFANKY